eukprot:XP_001710159.1 Hypothetical protein GL50803_20507 [Giardia lamblia ATCC 50803]
MTFSTISDAKWKKRPKSRTVKPSARMAKMRSSTPMSLLKNLPMNRPPRNIPRSPMICRIPPAPWIYLVVFSIYKSYQHDPYVLQGHLRPFQIKQIVIQLSAPFCELHGGEEAGVKPYVKSSADIDIVVLHIVHKGED